MTTADLRAALHVAALFGIYMSIAMVVPAFADFYVGDNDAVGFARLVALGTAFFAALAIATREGPPQLNRRMGVLLAGQPLVAGVLPCRGNPSLAVFGRPDIYEGALRVRVRRNHNGIDRNGRAGSRAAGRAAVALDVAVVRRHRHV